MKLALLVSSLIVALAGCSKRRPMVAAPAPPPPPVQQPSVTAPRRAPAPAPQTIDRSRAEQPATPAAPRLEPLTTPEERTAHLRELESIIRRAEDNTAALKGRRGATLPDDIARVVSLIRQARAAQAANDLPSARSFATRAEVLSTDLLRR